MINDFTFIYMLWGRSEIGSQTIASEAAMSIMSLKQHMPTSKIAVFIHRESMEPFIPFFAKYADYVIDTKCDKYKTYFSKCIMLYDVVKQFSNFLFLDSDTIVNKDFMHCLPDETLSFAFHCSTSRIAKVKRGEKRFFKSYFKPAGTVFSYKGHFNSSVIRVNMEKDIDFWEKYKLTLASLIDDFTYLQSVDIDDPYDMLLDFRNEYGTGLREPFVLDEHYFSIALLLNNLSLRNHTFSPKFYTADNNKYISHKKKTFVHEGASELIEVHKMWQKSGLELSDFLYPRIWPKKEYIDPYGDPYG
tara:strand:+ start:2606 stop:3514 length:909 start_codon:yes stop_codon:yes gene_type:complete